MIRQISGTIAEISSQEVFINIGFVVLQIWVPESSHYVLNDSLTLHTEMIWKETGPTLYGFAHKEDISLFNSLLKIPSVGPKLALSIMRYPRNLFLQACQSGNASDLCAISGVGKKTAQRIVAEIDLSLLGSSLPASSQIKPQARLTLLALGFQERIIDEALTEYRGDSLEDCIKVSLLKLGEHRVTSGKRSRTKTEAS